MTVDAYTLNMLYQKGILDYIPADLAMPIVPNNISGMQNPYLNQAMSGELYQNHGNINDSFSRNSYNSNISYDNSSIGVKSNRIYNEFIPQVVGTNAPMNFYGNQGIGSKSEAGMNAFGLSGIGNKTDDSNLNGLSGQGITQTISSAKSSPVFRTLLGIGLLVTAGLSIKKLFKGSSKKAAKEAAKQVQKTGILSKLNPKNWKIFHRKKK